MIRSRTTLFPAAALVLLLASACATAPRERLPAGPDFPGAVAVGAEVSWRNGLGPGVMPVSVYFARISGLSGSPCVPREPVQAGDDWSTGVSVAGTVDEGGVAGIGAVGGQGGFGGGADPTCLFNEMGVQVWEPMIYPATLVRGHYAWLLNVPPGRYVLVGARFLHDQTSSTTVYLSRADSEATEAVVPPGTARFLGRFVLKGGGLGKMDDLQAYYKSKVQPLEEGDKTHRLVHTLVNSIITESLAVNLHGPATLARHDTSPGARAAFSTATLRVLGQDSAWPSMFLAPPRRN